MRWHDSAFKAISASGEFIQKKFIAFAAVIALLNLLITLISAPLIQWYQSSYEYIQHGNPELPPIGRNVILSVLLILVIRVTSRTLELGWIRIALNVSRLQGEAEKRLTADFSRSLPRIVVIEIVRSLGIYIGLCLLIVPGIVLFYRWRFAMFICAEHPDYGPIRCLKESAAMTRGCKRQVFALDLTLITVYITALIAMLLTSGVVDLFMRPRAVVTLSCCYNDLSSFPQGPEEDPGEEFEDYVD